MRPGLYVFKLVSVSLRKIVAIRDFFSSLFSSCWTSRNEVTQPLNVDAWPQRWSCGRCTYWGIGSDGKVTPNERYSQRVPQFKWVIFFPEIGTGSAVARQLEELSEVPELPKEVTLST